MLHSVVIFKQPSVNKASLESEKPKWMKLHVKNQKLKMSHEKIPNSEF